MITGRVFRVNDGDTIQIAAEDGSEYKVRLHAIDAPELKQQFGETSRRELEKLVRRQTVTVYFQNRDRYGRIIGRVMLGETNVNLQQIANGAAWHFKRYQNEQTPADREAFAAAESTAKADRRGLWTTPNPQPPWDWRDSHQEP
jgi:endonuclease YncB( thermonuclease family)